MQRAQGVTGCGPKTHGMSNCVPNYPECQIARIEIALKIPSPCWEFPLEFPLQLRGRAISCRIQVMLRIGTEFARPA